MKKQTSSSFPGAVAPTTKKKKLGELDTLLLYSYGGKLPKYKNGSWLDSMSNGLLGFGSQAIGGGLLSPIFDAQMEAKADKDTKRNSMFAKYGITSELDPYDAWDRPEYKAYNTGKFAGKVTNEVGKVIAGAMTGMPVTPDVEGTKEIATEVQNKSYWDMPQNDTPKPFNNTLITMAPETTRAPLNVGDVGITDTPLQKYGGMNFSSKANYANGGEPINTLEGDLYSKIIMNRNKNKNFVDRAYNNSNPMYSPRINDDFSRSTHVMSWGEDNNGQAYMAPKMPYNYDSNGKLIEAIKIPNQYADYISSVGYKKATGMNYANGGNPNDDYNMQGALAAGLTADSTGHWQSVNPKDGMWLKSKEHPTAWMEYLYGYTLNPELNKNTNVVVNPSGYFGNNQLQYIPKKANGGSIQPQYEAEGGEVIQGSTPMVSSGGGVNRKASDMYKLNGNKHTNGGIEASNGEYIFSDKLKINKNFLSDI